MKIIFVIVLSFIFSLQLFSQKIKKKKYTSGEIASIETLYDRENHFKEDKVEVFNKKGEKVFEGYRRNYAGHSSIYLTYHNNGGVKVIETSSAPDAGIQWYKSKYILNEEGDIIEKWEISHDFKPTIITRFTEPSEIKK